MSRNKTSHRITGNVYDFGVGGLTRYSSSNRQQNNLPKRKNKTSGSARALDKEKLLQEIKQRLCRKQEAIEENQILKKKIMKVTSQMKLRTMPEAQSKNIMASIVEENEKLAQAIKSKEDQISNIKKSAYADSQVIKQQLNRLKCVYKQKKQAHQQRKLQKKRLKQLKIQRLNQQAYEADQAITRTANLRQLLQLVVGELRNCKASNNTLSKNCHKLQSEVTDLQLVTGSTPNSPNAYNLQKFTQAVSMAAGSNPEFNRSSTEQSFASSSSQV